MNTPDLLPRSRRLAFPIQEGWQFESIHGIIYMEAEGNYSSIHFEDHRLLVSRNLTAIALQLGSPEQFVRIHRSYLVNLDYLTRYIKGKRPTLELVGGIILPVSESRKQDLEDAIMMWFRF